VNTLRLTSALLLASSASFAACQAFVPPGTELAQTPLALAVSTSPASTSSSSLPDDPSFTGRFAAQSAPAGGHVPLQDQPHPKPTLLLLPRNLLSDGFHIITAPAYLRTGDLKWLLPLAGASAAAFATDTTTARDVVSHDPGFNNTAVNASNVLVGGFIAAPAALFVVGHLKNNEHAREAGFLGGEAMVDAAVVGEVVKLVSFRERPLVNNGRGNFYIGSTGANSSFVSEHAIIAWSSAAVLAAEYPTWWKQVAIYTLASGLPLSRVLGQQHFPSDVLIGGAGGWLIGHYVFRAHHHWHPTI
jgi:membrane-associated phospholipid phosphatase